MLIGRQMPTGVLLLNGPSATLLHLSAAWYGVSLHSLPWGKQMVAVQVTPCVTMQCSAETRLLQV